MAVIDPEVSRLLTLIQDSWQAGTFAKLSLGKYRGKDPTLRSVSIRRIVVQRESLLSFTYRYQKSDVVKNFDLLSACEVIGGLLGTDFRSAHLYTLAEDVQLEFNRRLEARISVSSPTFSEAPGTAHDRTKMKHLDLRARHWYALGIGDGRGGIRVRMGDKWKQVNKFVEVLASSYQNSSIKDQQNITIVDMGSGKGYLTFAAYEYFASVLKKRVTVRGIEVRPELVAFCNEVARDAGFTGLSFSEGSIKNADATGADILIALHACNTATDEALYKGIRANAALLMCAPCCYQEIRPQITSPDVLKPVLKQGILLERQAEILTDGLRAMILESEGYAAKVFEFASPEETLKNIMISATKRPGGAKDMSSEIAGLKAFYGIQEHALERLLQG